MTARRLWLAIVVGPLAWLVYLTTAYALVPWACRRPTGGMIALLAAGVVALALSTAGLITAWQAWRRVGSGTTAGTITGRMRFMALTGIGTSALFVLIVVAGMLPLLILAPCR
ncbi:MAG TPA: hypothetical protein VFQ62_15575 [Methylomirabilota bacterium]|nr:hypothetical protein [Methylomirabilota bacterium]